MTTLAIKEMKSRCQTLGSQIAAAEQQREAAYQDLNDIDDKLVGLRDLHRSYAEALEMLEAEPAIVEHITLPDEFKDRLRKIADSSATVRFRSTDTPTISVEANERLQYEVDRTWSRGWTIKDCADRDVDFEQWRKHGGSITLTPHTGDHKSDFTIVGAAMPRLSPFRISPIL